MLRKQPCYAKVGVLHNYAADSSTSPIGSRRKNVVPTPGSGVEAQRAAVLVDHDAAHDREALAGAAADLLGGEERIVDLVADRVGDAGAGVADRDLDLVAVAPGA